MRGCLTVRLKTVMLHKTFQGSKALLQVISFLAFLKLLCSACHGSIYYICLFFFFFANPALFNLKLLRFSSPLQDQGLKIFPALDIKAFKRKWSVEQILQFIRLRKCVPSPETLQNGKYANYLARRGIALSWAAKMAAVSINTKLELKFLFKSNGAYTSFTLRRLLTVSRCTSYHFKNSFSL